MSEETFNLLAILFFFISGIAVGVLVDDVMQHFKYERELNGFNAKATSWDDVVDYQAKRDKMGDWVCVNVRDMDFETAVETCNHEVGHEIFAEFCEDNMDKCVGVTKT